MEPAKILINGEWRISESIRPVVNPFSNQTVGEVYQASEKQIDEAIGAATDAFEATRQLSSFDRFDVLTSIIAGVEENKGKFADLITEETGKPISLSRSEVERSIFTLTIAAEEAKRIEGSVIPLDVVPNAQNRLAVIRRFPIGPVAAITPFNFPLNLVMHKVGPALACGNTLVLKPSSKAPRTALLLGEIAASTKLPAGAFNIVPCLSDEANQLITDQRIKLISFTGSPPVGWMIKSRAGKKKVLLELGGNAAAIVDKSADISFALKRIVQGAFANAGQSCISVQRVFVHEALYDKFSEQLVKMTRSIATGDPTSDRTVVGPMIDENAAGRVEGWVYEALAQGARLLCGGRRKGALLEPTVLVDVTPEMKVNSLEVFAPLVTLTSFNQFSDAVTRVNESVYGLQAAVFSNDLQNIFYAYRELNVGGVIVNDSSAYRMDHMPYGGIKDSGFGREGIRYAIEEMTELKILALNFP